MLYIEDGRRYRYTGIFKHINLNNPIYTRIVYFIKFHGITYGKSTVEVIDESLIILILFG